MTMQTETGSGPSGIAAAIAPTRQRPAQPTQNGPSTQQLRSQWSAYEGDFGPGGKLAEMPDVGDLNIQSNRMKPIVNTGVDFLFGPVLRIKCSDDQAQAILDATWGDDDKRMILLSKCGIAGGAYGHIFVKIIAPRRGTPSVTNPPRLVLLNSENLTIKTDPDDCDLVREFAITYASFDTNNHPIRLRQTVTRIDPDDDDSSVASGEDGDTTWQLQNWQALQFTGNTFVQVGPPQAWPYEKPPIADWQNYPHPSNHWGQPDVTSSLVALNTQLRITESNINTIGFLQGHPILFSTGANTSGMKPTPGQIMDLDNPDAKISAVVASGDLTQLMAFAETLRSDMDEESGVPSVATGRMEQLPKGQISGVTVRLLYSPLLARTEHKRRLYGQGIRQICETILLVCGYSSEDVNDLKIELGWQDPLPQDDLALAQTVVALESTGCYSKHTLTIMSGGDPETEATYLAEEAKADLDAQANGTAPPQPEPPPALPPGQPSVAPPPVNQDSSQEGTTA